MCFFTHRSADIVPIEGTIFGPKTVEEEDSEFVS